MRLNAPQPVRRGEIASYSVTFTNTSLNTFPLVDDCPLYRQSLGDAESGPLVLNCNGSEGVLVARCVSPVRNAIRRAREAAGGATTLRWQFIEPEEPALTAPVTVIETRSLDLHTVDWGDIAVPGRSCLHADDIQLHNGEALLPDTVHGNPTKPESNGPRYDALYEGRVPRDLEGDGHDYAFVPLGCNNNGGTADGLILDSFAVYAGPAPS